MVPEFNPENAVLRQRPFFVIVEVTTAETSIRCSGLAPTGDSLPLVLIGLLFASPTIGAYELSVVKAIMDELAKTDSWGLDDGTKEPLDSHIHFQDNGADITVRVFSIAQLSMIEPDYDNPEESES